MKVVKQKNMREQNELKNSKFSMNIGLVTSVIVGLSIIKDLVNIFQISDTFQRYMSVIFGLLVGLITLIILKIDLSSHYDNKKNLRSAIEFWTVFSVVVFILENSVLNVANGENRTIVIILLVFILIFSIGFTWWTIYRRKDRKFNID